MPARFGWPFAVVGLLAACGGTFRTLDRADVAWVDGTRTRWSAGAGAFAVRWTQRLVPTPHDAYIPVEHSTPAVDAAHDRVYAVSTTGTLWALSGNGRRLYRYQAGTSFEAGPLVDADKQELYAVSEDGTVHALSALSGALRWKVDSGVGATRRPPLLVDDALYVVSDTDQVVALSRADGEVLWRYKRQPTDGYHVVGHAGLTLADGRLFAAFSDGVIAALDPSDGHVLWERDTALDFPPGEAGTTQRLVDVDTTPVIVGSTLYAASLAGGLYGLDVASGSVASQRTEMTGITSLLVLDDGDLVIGNADGTLKRVEPVAGAVRWTRKVSRGAPGQPVLREDVLFVSETGGGFIGLDVNNGRELARVEAGHGFTAAPVFAERRGFVMSNGGTLFALTLP